jgi:hypothetical protein
MRKITNRDEANDYYKIINKGVDEFASKANARPSEVHKYLKNNKKRFLKQLELNDVDGIENVLGDVISHRKHLQDDKVITFENFSKFNENFVALSKPTIDFEKVLADKFNTSLGHIEIVDPQYHLYKINDFGKVVFCMCFTKDDYDRIKGFVSEQIIEIVKSKVLSVSDFDSFTMPSLKFWLSEFVDASLLENLVKSKIDSEYVNNFVFLTYSLSTNAVPFSVISKIDSFSEYIILTLD